MIGYASTLWVAAAKGDEHKPLTGSLSSVFISAYKEMLTVLRLPAVKSMALVLLTCRAALGVFDAATPLRLVEAGVPREHLALMSSALFPVGLASQMYVSGRYFAGGGEGSQPLLIWLACYPARLLLGLTSLCIVLLVPAVKSPTTGLPSWMYFLIMLAAMVASVTSQTMFVAQMAFYNRVADPAIGGTYMTMLNTISNMGGAWPSTAALYLVGLTTIKGCVPRESGSDKKGLLRRLAQLGKAAESGCDESVMIDGYVITCLVCLCVGVAWYRAMKPRIQKLQRLPPAAWLAAKKR